MAALAKPATIPSAQESGERLNVKTRKALFMASAVLLVGVVARAHAADPIADLIARASASRPVGPPTTDADRVALTWVLSAARRGDVVGARAAIGSISNPLARKTALWTLTDAASESLTFSEADGAWRDLADWPRPERRQIAAEQLLEASGKSPSEVVAWFEGQEPRSARGVMVLASAYRALGRTELAANLIRHWWRDVSFEADDQHAMLARFADVLTPDDHTRRADILLYGPQGPAARAMIDMLAADRQPAARARIALRSNARDAESRVSALSQADQTSPGVAFERAGYLRRRGQEARALSLVAHFPGELTTPEQAARIWYERVRLVLIAIREGNWRGAYLAAANSGLTRGAAAADAEFFAGWIALTRLNDPQAAGRHFAAIEQIGSTPITRGRAFYWMGRTAEARKDTAAAQAFYAASAEYQTVFYGQLAAEKLGLRLTLVSDPVLTVADRQQFEAQELVRAARLLADSGHPDLFRVFVLHLDDVVPTVRDAAMLVDLIRGYGDQASAMRAVRASAQRGSDPDGPWLSPRSTAADQGWSRTGPSAWRYPTGKRLRPSCPLRRQRPWDDAASAAHRPDRGPTDRGQLLAQSAERARLQHDPWFELPGPARKPILGLLCHGHRGLQRRAQPTHAVVGLLRRSPQPDH